MVRCLVLLGRCYVDIVPETLAKLGCGVVTSAEPIGTKNVDDKKSKNKYWVLFCPGVGLFARGYISAQAYDSVHVFISYVYLPSVLDSSVSHSFWPKEDSAEYVGIAASVPRHTRYVLCGVFNIHIYNRVYSIRYPVDRLNRETSHGSYGTSSVGHHDHISSSRDSICTTNEFCRYGRNMSCNCGYGLAKATGPALHSTGRRHPIPSSKNRCKIIDGDGTISGAS